MTETHYIAGGTKPLRLYIVATQVQIKRKEAPNLQRSDFQFFVIYMKDFKVSTEHLLKLMSMKVEKINWR